MSPSAAKTSADTKSSVNTILIVGASRGLGYGLAKEFIGRGWRVIATERKNDPQSPLRKFAKSATDHLRIEEVDINVPQSVDQLKSRLQKEKLDVLLVNAGVTDDKTQTIGEVTTEEFTRVLVTNALSPLRVIEKLGGLVVAKGTIAAMSSGLASVAENTTGSYETYRASKAALNTLLKSYAVRAGQERTVLAVVPGWVRTDMGGPEAPLELETSCRGMAEMILERSGKGGVAFANYENQDVAW